MLGTAGDAAVLSFGIEKTLRTKAGGALLINNPDTVSAMEAVIAGLPPLSRGETFRWLMWPVLKSLLWRLPDRAEHDVDSIIALERLTLLRRAVAPEELEGGRPPGTPSRMSGAIAEVVLGELDGLQANLAHRVDTCRLYRGPAGGRARALSPARLRPSTHSLCRSVCDLGNEKRGSRRIFWISRIRSRPGTTRRCSPKGVDLNRIGYDASRVLSSLERRSSGGYSVFPLGYPAHSAEIARWEQKSLPARAYWPSPAEGGLRSDGTAGQVLSPNCSSCVLL